MRRFREIPMDEQTCRGMTKKHPWLWQSQICKKNDLNTSAKYECNVSDVGILQDSWTAIKNLVFAGLLCNFSTQHIIGKHLSSLVRERVK